ncbi:hypothetical protein J7E99_22020 [Streptomyces sp. ISL-44]|uniref:hypothetical protein n=1 Tax=Streptomyces sp. ISL-44 TaxID=2819184 RepID=UPI001BEAE708|nr:hypothetical protein [Streptomyces sp. ISL-44]MBT2543299.1 hypothetical protein [Streptomyces sp. ISL-44]
MSHTTHRPRHARPARRTSRYLLAFASAAFISGAIALPASAATAPAAPPLVASVLSDTPAPDNDDTVEYGGDVGGDRDNGAGYDEETGDFTVPPSDPGPFGRGGSGGSGGAPGSGRYNALHPNRDPNGGAYGPNTCLQGYVWRESFDGDTFCVTPEERDVAKSGNNG